MGVRLLALKRLVVAALVVFCSSAGCLGGEEGKGNEVAEMQRQLCRLGDPDCIEPIDCVCEQPANPCMYAICNPRTGSCIIGTRADGVSCDDENACSGSSTCQSGKCTGTEWRDCSSYADQCNYGTCNASTGACYKRPKSNGTACNDGSLCTQSDTCQSGQCVGANPVDCSGSTDACNVGRCNSSTGACYKAPRANGTACNDGSLCTQSDTCQSGSCTGANPVTCAASDQCHNAGTCDPKTGTCSNPAKTNGTACNDGSACTQSDTCQSGACSGADPVTCTASDQCHNAGTCDPKTGTCSNPAKTNGTACNDGSACTQSDTCQSGSCSGANPVTCTASDQCHNAGTCDPKTGTCSNPAKTNGTACND
ncbi:MAG: hypothetical protein HY698_00590, partial [Deltaproteobacteria bacterium]|nr:hypothetical protein [Deltaproteobacteria bacterium]